MDAHLLAALPDAAKLSILRKLGHSPAGNPPSSSQPQPQQHVAEGFADGGDAAPACDLLAGQTMAGGVLVSDAFLPEADILAAREEAQQVLAGAARPAGMTAAAQGRERWVQHAARGDEAAWLSPASLQAAGHRHLAAAVQRLLSLRPWLRRQGFHVGGRTSCQLARYPGGGARYMRHRDASASAPHRCVTAILYLNPGWTAADGGQLCVYCHAPDGGDPRTATAADLRLAAAAGPRQGPEGGPGLLSGLEEGQPALVVPPAGGRLVLMDSRLLHEVLPAHAERLALTVWFPREAPPAPAAAAAPPGVGADAPGVTEGLAALHVGAGGAAREERQQAGSAVQAGQPLQQPDREHLGDGLPQSRTAEPPQQAAGQPGQQAPAPAAPRLLAAAAVTAPGLIFVSVPAHRDSEARWTVADLFARAARPERLRVGIAWQVALPQDAPLMALELPQRWLGQVRQVVLPASEATGPCKARALAHQLWEGEEFVLQVDAHTRFVPGWDDALLRALRQAQEAAGHPRVVLSAYPPGYEVQGAGGDAVLPPPPLPATLCAAGWGPQDGLLRLRARKLRQPLARPAPALFWAAGLSFSRAQLLLEAPYSRDLPGLFFGEEVLQLARMWLAGWDVFTPPAAVAFHQWDRKQRPSYLEHHPPGWEQRRRSQQRVAAALAGQEENGAAGGSLLGPASAAGRRLQQFWEHCGVNFRDETISTRALNGGLPPDAFL